MLSSKQGISVVLAVLGITLLIAIIKGNSNYDSFISKSLSDKFKMNNAPSTNSFVGEVDGFTQEEILFFTTGAGNRTLLGKRLPLYIRNQMSKPSKKFLRRGAGGQTDFSQGKKSHILDKLMGLKTNGFFIECGALDGTSQSNSVYFELTRNWSGLLIEGNLRLRPQLLGLGRNAFVLNSCLSLRTTPMLAKFKIEWGVGGLSDTLNNYASKKFAGNQELLLSCYPFNSVLDAINVTHVDLMTLDVEGSELPIMKTIDFHKYKIDTFMVEFAMYPSISSADKSAKRLKEFRAFFDQLGLYKEMAITTSGDSGVLMDIIYQRKDYLAARAASPSP